MPTIIESLTFLYVYNWRWDINGISFPEAYVARARRKSTPLHAATVFVLVPRSGAAWRLGVVRIGHFENPSYI